MIPLSPPTPLLRYCLRLQPLMLLFLLHLQAFPLCAGEPPQPLQVMVSILPQQYFVRQIGGDHVTVTTLVQPGDSPATYTPKPRQMALLAGSRVYFRIGVPFENGLIPKLRRSLPGLEVVDLRQNISLLPSEHDAHGDNHGDMDPHTWLDPGLALQQASTIRDTLARIDPDNADTYSTNFAQLEERLIHLDGQLREMLKPFSGSTIYVFHPAYGYFCRAYDLIQKAINPEGKITGANQLARFIEEARQDNVKAIFIQPQFSEKSAQTIANAIGARVIPLDPLGENYLEDMQTMTRLLTSALSGQLNTESGQAAPGNKPDQRRNR